MNKVIALIFGMMLLPLHGQAAEVYKWKDATGAVRYSDTPPPGRTPYESLSGKKAAAARGDQANESAPAPATDVKAAKPAPTVADKEVEARKRKAEAENLQKKAQEKQDQQKIREQNCIAAKSNMQSFKQGGRMYKIDEKGERHYLDEAEITAGLDKAAKEVEQWCGDQ